VFLEGDVTIFVNWTGSVGGKETQNSKFWLKKTKENTAISVNFAT
jgi:hypothetical protein